MEKETLHESHSCWASWAGFLRQHGLEHLAIWILESLSPLALIGAQMLYLGKPLLQPAFRGDQIISLAHLLEDTEESLAFVAYLRNEDAT